MLFSCCMSSNLQITNTHVVCVCDDRITADRQVRVGDEILASLKGEVEKFARSLRLKPKVTDLAHGRMRVSSCL